MITVNGIEFGFHPSPPDAAGDCGRYHCGFGTLPPQQQQARFLSRLLGRPIIIIFNEREIVVDGYDVGPGAAEDMIAQAEGWKRNALAEYERNLKYADEQIAWWRRMRDEIAPKTRRT